MVPSNYNGNGSDSDDEQHRIRNALGEKIRSMKEPMTEKEKRIINYIIAKKYPVYGFMQFSFDKEKNKAKNHFINTDDNIQKNRYRNKVCATRHLVY